MRFLYPAAALACAAGCVHSAPRSAQQARPPYSATELARVVRHWDVAISDDGGEVAFASDRTGAVELWTVSLRGGACAEPVQRSRANEKVSGLAYGPDGTLVYQQDRGGDERYDLFALRPGSAPIRLLETPSRAEIGPRFSPDGRHLAFSADPDRPFRFDLFVRDLATGEERRLTRGELNVVNARWSRDGRTLAALRTGDFQTGELLLVDVDGREARVIAPEADGLISPVDFLPDGRLLATATNSAGFLQLAVVDADGRVTFVGPAEGDVDAAWVGDDGAVVYVRNVRGEAEVVVADGPVAFATAPRVLAHAGYVSAGALTRSGRRLVTIEERIDRPTALVSRDVLTGTATELAPPNAAAVRLADLDRGELRTIPSFDGKPIDVFLWKPPVARLGTPPPAVVLVHGGPNAQVRGMFLPKAHALAEAGFVVIAPNYRGSTGYGRAFEDLNNKDWGGGDLRDLLAAVDALAASRAIDPARVGITGGSYGGYMTLRAITAEPDRFAAAVELYGMPDLVQDYEMTKDRFGPFYETEMGTPATHPDLFRERSPVNALDRVRTPLLVLQGANDSNVPKWESDLVVERLRSRGVEVEYVVYPDEGHGFTRRDNVDDSITRSVKFFVEHLSRR